MADGRARTEIRERIDEIRVPLRIFLGVKIVLNNIIIEKTLISRGENKKQWHGLNPHV